MNLHAFELKGADGKLIRGDRADGVGRQILFITGFLSKRWGNKSKALAQWCEQQGWGFCCYDVRGFGDSEGTFTDYTLSDWMDDARAVISMQKNGPDLTPPGYHHTLPPRACQARLLFPGTRLFPDSPSSAIRSAAGLPG